MKRSLYIPIEQKVPFLEKINKKWRTKKVMIALLSALLTTGVLFGGYALLFYFETAIPYSKDLIQINVHQDQKLSAHYYGKSYSGIVATHPISVEVNGEQKQICFLFYKKTFADSPSRNLINDEQTAYEYVFQLPESESVDAVYYVEIDTGFNIRKTEDYWKKAMERGLLIWER